VDKNFNKGETMTIKETKTEMDKTIKSIPVILWSRFKSRCAAKDLSIPQGFIEAVTEWLEKD
jgi:hypothetical protein